jgi:hypothetical protein
MKALRGYFKHILSLYLSTVALTTARYALFCDEPPDEIS